MTRRCNAGAIHMTEEKTTDQEKKIIIDEDWKTEAKQEKEKLVAEEKTEEKTEEKAEEKAPAADDKRPPLPEGNFSALLSMLVTQTMFALGALQMDGQEPREPDFELARYHIEMLQTLTEITKGNLSEQEDEVLSRTLNDLRMTFVQLSGQ